MQVHFSLFITELSSTHFLATSVELSEGSTYFIWCFAYKNNILDLLPDIV